MSRGVSKKSMFGFLEDEGRRGGLRLSRDQDKHEAWTQAILPAEAAGELNESEADRRPLRILAGLVFVVLSLILVRLFYLQIVAGAHNMALANGNRIRERVARAPRGVIYDSKMTELASNQPSFDLTVIPQLMPKDAQSRTRSYDKLASLTGHPAAEIGASAEITCRAHHEPGCLNTPVPQLVLAGLPRDVALLIDQESIRLPGFALDVNPIRKYADQANLLSAFLGYTGRLNEQEAKDNPDLGPTDLIGKLGIEEQYEKVLRGQNGGQRTEVDATGRPVRVLANRDPTPGNNLVMSIDSALQQQFSAAIQRQMDASGSKRAAGVAMDPRTGKILAAVSLPGYDNNKFSQGISAKDYQALIKDPGQPLFNKVTSGGYPSGSIIKPLGVSAALQEGIVTLATVVMDAGKIIVPNKYDPSKPATYKGWESDRGLGPVNPLTAIARSSDIFFYKVMGGLFGTDEDFTHPLGVERLTNYYKLFGLGAKTGIDLPTEAAGRVPTPAWKKAFSGEDWFTGDTYNIAVGQGDLLVSPLQMANAISAIANGGTLFAPQLVNRVIDNQGKTVQEIKPEIKRQNFVRSDYLAQVRRGMWMTINDPQGTAWPRIHDEVPVQVAGKTGTAETVVHDAGEDAKDQSKPHAWFEAFAPYENPQIVMVVLVEHSGEGAQYAAPAVRETLKWYFTEGAGAKR